MLMKEVEDRIEKWLVTMVHIGYGQTKNVLNKVQELVTKTNIATPFVDGHPSNKWYRLFMKHHLDLHMRMLSCLSKKQCQVSFNNLYDWFQGFDKYLKQMNNRYLRQPDKNIQLQ